MSTEMNTVEQKKKERRGLKMLFVAIVALLLLIPLLLIKSVIEEREYLRQQSVNDIQSSWAESQCFVGPMLRYSDEKVITKEDGKKEKEITIKRLYPTQLHYGVSAQTETLHRSIYDVTVYTSNIDITGQFTITPEVAKKETVQLRLVLSDLRGIVGDVVAQFGDKDYEFVADNEETRKEQSSYSYNKTDPDESSIITMVNLPASKTENVVVPFTIKLKVRGSESMDFRPVGRLTEVEMTSNCVTPSFNGDFLPTEREVNDEGFTAKWVVSQINRGAPESSKFGVKMLQPVTQYQQTTRANKYGMLIIVLIFLAGFIAEKVTKKEINLLQYIIIGCSLVLFYMLLLAFSEFMAFWLSFLLAAAMTTISLTAYFRAILRNRLAYFLGLLVAVAYIISYVMMQMEMYAMLCSSLLLFVGICFAMYFTRNSSSQPNKD